MSDSIITIFFFQAEDGIRALYVTGVQTCALPICPHEPARTNTGVDQWNRVLFGDLGGQGGRFKSCRPGGRKVGSPNLLVGDHNSSVRVSIPVFSITRKAARVSL